jgi:TRAP-type C4-dicarboxylate transport system permease small subunit
LKTRLKAFTDGLVNVLEYVELVLLLVMMSSLMWQVITRFIIKIPSVWTEEIARYSFIYMILIGAAIGVRRSNHFGMTIFSDKWRGRLRDLYFRYVINVLILFCSLFLFIFGVEFTVSYGLTRVSPTFLVPMAWVFAALPISATLMSYFAFYNIFFEDFSADPCHCIEDETIV